MLILAALLVMPADAGPRKETHKKHVFWYQDTEHQADKLTFFFEDPFAGHEEGKVRVQTTNGTGDFVLVAHDGLTWDVNGKTFTPDGKAGRYDFIAPMGEKKQTFAFPLRGADFHGRDPQLTLTGVWTLSAEAPVQTAPDFQLPVAKPDFTVGDFRCKQVGDATLKTDKASFAIECLFTGEPGTAGIVKSSAATFVIADGSEFSNEAGSDADIVMPGDSVKLKFKNTVIQPRPHGVDMQFDTFAVTFGDTFRQGALVKVAVEPVTLAVDATRTAENN